MNRKNDRKWLELLVLAAWAGFFIFVLATHRLPFYINPKFTLLPIVGALILLGMVAVTVMAMRGQRFTGGHDHPISWTSGSWNLLPIILGLIVAPAALGSFVASHHGGINMGGGGDNGIQLNLASDSKFQSCDLLQLTEAGHISKGNVTVEGEISTDGPTAPAGECALIHYRMTCCVADLQTIGALLKYKGVPGFRPVPGQWVSVRGTAERTPAGVEIVADEIDQISPPDPPYLY